jgi:hypothetical protein
MRSYDARLPLHQETTNGLGGRNGCLANELDCGDGVVKGSAQTRRQRDRDLNS